MQDIKIHGASRSNSSKKDIASRVEQYEKRAYLLNKEKEEMEETPEINELGDEKYEQILRSIKLKQKEKSHKGEQNESELTEKCWSGYTQKGMNTMFGKRYPNCVKKTKK